MADNYLEKQYEQYQAKKAAWEKARKLGLKKPLPLVKKTVRPSSADKEDEKSR